ncbi:MAG: hypothetical protein K8S98_11095 [Planctomycetes bacterium]|nr:hypothetical protein [Planctomycetota bacterium]
MTQRIAARARRGGYTLIETAAAVAVFMVVWYSLGLALKMGNESQRAVSRIAEESRALRKSISELTDELRTSTDSSVVTATLADGNDSVSFMVPIDVAGVADWGVYDKRLGPLPADRNRPDWRIRYTVASVDVGAGVIEKQLVREVVDDLGAVRRQDTLARGLRPGVGAQPGFRVTKNGAVWELTLSTVGTAGVSKGEHEVFHVRTRNDD